MDDKDKKLRGKLEGLFSDLPRETSTQAAGPVSPSAAVLQPSSTGPDVEALRAELSEVKQALSESQAHFREWFDEAPFGYHELDKQGCIVRVNHTEAEMLGYTIEEMLGRPAWEFIQESEVSRQAIADQLAGRLPQQSAERIFVRKDGSLVNVLIQDQYLLDADGKIRGIRTTVQDITSRKQAEEALTRERGLLRTLIDNLPDLIYVKDTQSCFLVANEAEALLMGAHHPDELLGKSDADYFPPELANKYLADERALFESGQAILNIEEPTVDTQGNPKWIVTTKVPLRDSQGKIVGLVGMGRDITERKQAEEALRENEEKYRTILENMQEGYFEVDLAGNFTFFNDALCRVLGYHRDELMGMNNRDYMDAENAKAVYRVFNEVYRTRRPSPTFNYEVFRKDGTRRSVETSTSLMTDSTGEPIGFHGILRDITDRKRTEEALVREQYLMNALMDNVPDYIYFKDLHSRFIRTTRAHAKAFGLSDPAEAVGKTDFDFFTEEHARPAYKDEQEIIRTGQPLSKEEKETWPDHPDTWVLTTKMPLRDKAGNIVGTFGISSDITERKQAEAERERLMASVEHRALQLQTTTEVSRAISSLATLDELLPQMVELIRDRFNLYYVGIFLVDEAGKYAVLRAGTGDAGRKMLEASHKLEVGGASMIGWCIANQKARIALDVGEEAARLSNPLLPLTRSEMALPLIYRDYVIGAMTIQSDQPAAFTQEDINVLQSMADQTANAIENARLFETTQRRAAREQLTRQITDNIRAAASVEDAMQRAVGELARVLGTAELVARIGTEQDLLVECGAPGHGDSHTPGGNA